MKRRWLQIVVAVIVILVFVLSYVDFGPLTQPSAPAVSPSEPPADFQNPTGPPQIEGPVGPPPED